MSCISRVSLCGLYLERRRSMRTKQQQQQQQQTSYTNIKIFCVITRLQSPLSYCPYIAHNTPCFYQPPPQKKKKIDNNNKCMSIVSTFCGRQENLKRTVSSIFTFAIIIQENGADNMRDCSN